MYFVVDPNIIIRKICKILILKIHAILSYKLRIGEATISNTQKNKKEEKQL